MTLDMPRKLPPFVTKERNRHGRVVLYFRRGKGKRTRLPDDTQSDAFRDAYEAALSGKQERAAYSARVPSDTLQWLAERYMESGRWANLSPATRKQQSLLFQDAIRRGNNPAYKGITRKTMMRAMDARASTPALANNFLKAMRGLFKWAVRNDYIDTDPSADVEGFRYKTDGFKVWDLADVEAFCTKWPVGTKPRLAFELYLVSGLRRSDVHRAGPQHLKGDILGIRAFKPPHHMITVKVPQFLLDTIALTETGDMVFVTKENGDPFLSKESFGNWFGARCREAGLEKGKAAHGIRKFAATVAANAGDTTHELMSHFGWSNPQQAEVYTRGADRKRLGLRSSERSAEHLADMMPRTGETGAGIIGNNAVKSNVKNGNGGR
jgi:integrase